MNKLEKPPANFVFFELWRNADQIGISGNGKVAIGCYDSSDTHLALLVWRGQNSSAVVYPTLETLLTVHCSHSGTSLEFVTALDKDDLDRLITAKNSLYDCYRTFSKFLQKAKLEKI